MRNGSSGRPPTLIPFFRMTKADSRGCLTLVCDSHKRYKNRGFRSMGSTLSPRYQPVLQMFWKVIDEFRQLG